MVIVRVLNTRRLTSIVYYDIQLQRKMATKFATATRYHELVRMDVPVSYFLLEKEILIEDPRTRRA
jgi:hypothetical protein